MMAVPVMCLNICVLGNVFLTTDTTKVYVFGYQTLTAKGRLKSFNLTCNLANYQTLRFNCSSSFFKRE